MVTLQPAGKFEEFFVAIAALKTTPAPAEVAQIFEAHEMKVMAMFVLYKIDLFNVVNSSLIRNEDSTRLFIFVTSDSQLFSQPETGTYQLMFTYKRDVGSSKPLLRRFGFYTQEETLIQFTLDYPE